MAAEEPERVTNDKEREERKDDSETDEAGDDDRKCKNEPETEAKPGTKTEESTAKNVELPSEGPYMTRKEYMNTLTPYRMAHYIAEEYERHSLLASALAYPSQLIDWLTQDVDDQGREIVDV